MEQAWHAPDYRHLPSISSGPGLIALYRPGLTEEPSEIGILGYAGRDEAGFVVHPIHETLFGKVGMVDSWDRPMPRPLLLADAPLKTVALEHVTPATLNVDQALALLVSQVEIYASASDTLQTRRDIGPAEATIDVAYAVSDGRAVFAINLVPTLTYDGVFSPFWFLQERDGKVRWIGAALDFLSVVETDDNSSRLWVFWLADYNRDGYVCFSEDFSKRIEVSWGYH